MNILFLDIVHPSLFDGLVHLGFNCYQEYAASKEDVMKSMFTYNGIVIRSRFKLDKEFLDACKNLKFIARVGAGMENIDVEYAESNGIKCLHAPEGNRTAVAEHAIGMLLSLMNNLMKADAEVRNNFWIREGNRGYELEGKTVGIIGYGNMGSAFAQRLQGFGVDVLCYDKYKQNYISNNFSKEVTLKDITENADVLSIHLPYNTETHYLINEQFIQSFKKPFYFINTSRGNIANTQHIVDALQSGKIIGACLDVLEYETLNFENIGTTEPPAFTALKQMKNVVLSPHIAGWTYESNKKMAEVLVEKIKLNFSPINSTIN
jgi:D-3-phosphoglycerate dehydrogenase